jgi:hypothetical protein
MRYSWIKAICVIGIVLLLVGNEQSVLVSAQSPQAAWNVIGQVGGPTTSVAIRGNYAYVGVGLKLTVIDISNPASVREVGSTQPFTDFVQAVVVNNQLAYVAAGKAGLRVIDISKPATPREIGFLDTHGYAEGVTVIGETAYLADGPYGLRLIDVSEPAVPVEIGSVYELNYAFGVAVSGRFAYIAAGGAGLLIADVSNRRIPVEIAQLDTSGYAYGISVYGSTAFIADGWEGLQIVNVNDPGLPVLIGTLHTQGQLFDVTVDNQRAYAANDYRGLQIIDVSDLAHPQLMGSYETLLGHVGKVVVSGNVAYLADSYGGLRVIDVTNPNSLVQKGIYTPMGYADGVYVSGNYAYVAAATYGLRILDISRPANPHEIGFSDTQGYATSVTVDGNYAFVCTMDWPTRLLAVDVKDKVHPSLAGQIALKGMCRETALANDIVYVADEWGIELISVVDPHNPTFLGFLQLAWVATNATASIAVSGTRAYVGAAFAGLHIVDVSDPRMPRLVGQYADSSTFVDDVAVQGNQAYLIDRGLRILDITDPTQPQSLGFLETKASLPTAVAVYGSIAYVLEGNLGLSVVDISDLANPLLIGHTETEGSGIEVFSTGDALFTANGSTGLLILSPEAKTETSNGNAHRSSQDVLEARGAEKNALSLRDDSSRGIVASTEAVTTNRPHDAPQSRLPSFVSARDQGLDNSSCIVTSPSDNGYGSLRLCIEEASPGTTITFDPVAFPPTHPTSIRLESPPLWLSQGGVTIDASNAGVVLDGSQLSGDAHGLSVTSDGNTIRGLQILYFPGNGISIGGKSNVIGGDYTKGSSPSGQGNVISGNHGQGIDIGGEGAYDNIVVGNLVGTDSSGSQALPNGQHGIYIGAHDNRIGSANPYERNVVSGNSGNGISMMTGAHDNLVIGNFVGTDREGVIEISNQGHGVSAEVGGFGNTIEGNLTSGNGRSGIALSDWHTNSNVVAGNLIGTDATGTKALGNHWSGVSIGFMGASFNRVGGTRPADRNVISGNDHAGIELMGPGDNENIVLGNYIGVDITGTKALANLGGGVVNGGCRALIGGATPAERNVISGNKGSGLEIHAGDNYISGNTIGSDASGTLAIANEQIQIRITEKGYNFIQNNTISGSREENGANGTGIFNDSSHNTIRHNSIYGNSGKGIWNSGDANALLAPPAITANPLSGISALTCSTCTVEMFGDAEDEGQVYLGSAIADQAGMAYFNKVCPPSGFGITATATDMAGNTSEFSNPVQIAWDCNSPNAVPVLQSVTPVSVAALAPTFVITLTGTGFANGAKVFWGSDELETNYVSTTQLTAVVSSIKIMIEGTRVLTVFNPEPGGGLSNSIPLIILPANKLFLPSVERDLYS